MKIKKIHIIGVLGSGRSYASKILPHSLKLSYYDLDDVYFDGKVKEDLTKNFEKGR